MLSYSDRKIEDEWGFKDELDYICHLPEEYFQDLKWEDEPIQVLLMEVEEK